MQTHQIIAAAIAAIDGGATSSDVVNIDAATADADRRYLAGALEDLAAGRCPSESETDALSIAREYLP